MKLYQASLYLQVLKDYHERFKEKLNVLLSFAYMAGQTKGFLIDCRHMVGSIIADSGAWSVARNIRDLKIGALISYLRLWGDCFDIYFNFDTDFTDHGFENNIVHQIQMERAGLKPVPVIHNFFDQEIPFYIQSGKYDWLALGSSQSSNYDDFRYAVDRIKTVDPNIRIHWFGGSKYEWLIDNPIASCDTSSWAATGTYGHIHYWNPHEEKVNKTHKIYISGLMDREHDSYHFVTYPWRKELEEYLYNDFGYSYQDLCGYDDKHLMQVVNARFYAELEKRINEERLKRGIPLD